jgi:hypothetical protein
MNMVKWDIEETGTPIGPNTIGVVDGRAKRARCTTCGRVVASDKAPPGDAQRAIEAHEAECRDPGRREAKASTS